MLLDAGTKALKCDMLMLKIGLSETFDNLVYTAGIRAKVSKRDNIINKSILCKKKLIIY